LFSLSSGPSSLWLLTRPIRATLEIALYINGLRFYSRDRGLKNHSGSRDARFGGNRPVDLALSEALPAQQLRAVGRQLLAPPPPGPSGVLATVPS
jgi:hypothetical protein